MRERRRPRMPNDIGPHLEHRGVAFALAHPGLGPRRISAELGREKWGGIRISEHGVWRVLMRVGLNTRSKRLALVARHRDPCEHKPELPEPERHIDATEPGQRSSSSASSRSAIRDKGHCLAVHAIDVAPPTPGPSSAPPSATPARAPPASSRTAWRASSNRPDGSWARSVPTTGPSSAPSTSATRSRSSQFRQR
jgi:hypothetical protein